MLSVQTTKKVPSLWHGSLDKDLFGIYYREKKTDSGFLQTHLFLSGSLLLHHKQPSFSLFSDGWITVTALRISHSGSPTCPRLHWPHFSFSTVLPFKVPGLRTLIWELPFGPRRLLKARSANPELQTRSQNRGRVGASSRLGTGPVHCWPRATQAGL